MRQGNETGFVVDPNEGLYSSVKGKENTPDKAELQLNVSEQLPSIDNHRKMVEAIPALFFKTKVLDEIYLFWAESGNIDSNLETIAEKINGENFPEDEKDSISKWLTNRNKELQEIYGGINNFVASEKPDRKDLALIHSKIQGYQEDSRSEEQYKAVSEVIAEALESGITIEEVRAKIAQHALSEIFTLFEYQYLIAGDLEKVSRNISGFIESTRDSYTDEKEELRAAISSNDWNLHEGDAGYEAAKERKDTIRKRVQLFSDLYSWYAEGSTDEESSTMWSIRSRNIKVLLGIAESDSAYKANCVTILQTAEALYRSININDAVYDHNNKIYEKYVEPVKLEEERLGHLSKIQSIVETTDGDVEIIESEMDTIRGEWFKTRLKTVVSAVGSGASLYGAHLLSEQADFLDFVVRGSRGEFWVSGFDKLRVPYGEIPELINKIQNIKTAEVAAIVAGVALAGYSLYELYKSGILSEKVELFKEAINLQKKKDTGS